MLNVSPSFADGNDHNLHFAGIGSDRMNWANNQTKLYTIDKLADKWTLFADARMAVGL